MPVDKSSAIQNNSTALSQKAGLIVTALSAVFALAILIILAFQIYLIESSPSPLSGEAYNFKCQDSKCYIEKAKLLLENDALVHRTSRVQSAIASRLSISVVAEVVALSLVVLGGVLIFDRIQGQGETVSATKKPSDASFSFFLSTSFPGVLLCFFGSVTLVLAMWFPTLEGARIRVLDLPVFTVDQNFTRNRVFGYAAGTNLTATNNNIVKQKPEENQLTPQFTEKAEGDEK